MRKALILDATAVLVVGATAAWKVQRDMDEQEEAWLARAGISPDEAQRIALTAFPGGRIVESELEEENGRLIHSFEVEVPGHPGVVDVEVDAMTGELLPPDADDEDDDSVDDDGDDDGGRRGG